MIFKKKKMAVVSLALAASMVLAACGGAGTGGGQTPATPAPVTGTNQPAQPVVTGPERLDTWLFDETFNFRVVQAQRPIYEDDNMIEQAINRMLNVNVEYIRIPEAQFNEQLGLLLASRDLPDIVYFGGFVPPSPFNEWAMQGAIIPLDNLIESHGQDIAGRWRADDWSRVRSDVDGLIYGIPAFTDLLEAFSLQLRADWLENLNLPIPSTLDEWVMTLEAIRDGDPRGDGTSVIPFAGLLRPFENAFGIQSTTWQVFDDVYLSRFDHPNYIEYLNFMRDLYARGLIDPEYFTRNLVLADIENLFFADMAFAVEQWAAFTRSVTDVVGEVTPNARMIGVDPIIGPYGHQQIMGRARWMSVGSITSMAQEPEKLMTYLNWFFTDAGVQLTNFGIEGETFEFVNGEPRLLPEFSTFEASRRVGMNKTTEAIIMTQEYFLQCLLEGGTLEEAGPSFQIFHDALMRNSPFIYIPAIQYTSPTFVSQWAGIYQILRDAEVQAIIGNITVDDFINQLEGQRAAGLGQINIELNEVFARTR